ncbi:hypothetical protein COCOBI_09-5550 [Coccomyxa sp. Obi]|nr:hypothetical protein COCOBI_09-5550 [Coccomyxa sp. Obi]
MSVGGEATRTGWRGQCPTGKGSPQGPCSAVLSGTPDRWYRVTWAPFRAGKGCQKPPPQPSTQPSFARWEVKIARWSGFSLSLLGRAYVAKQLLASMITYHATFIKVPSQLEKSLCTALHTFVAASRPVLGGTSARLYPGKDTCFHAVKDGGIALVDLRAQILALQAKVVSRLMEPEQLAWKAFFDFWLYRSTAWQRAQGPDRLAAHEQHTLGDWGSDQQTTQMISAAAFELSMHTGPPLQQGPALHSSTLANGGVESLIHPPMQHG